MASIFATLVITCLTANSALSARIVGFTSMASGSHYLLTMTILEELASRGHEVVMVVSSDHMHSRSSEKIPHKVYQVPFERGYLEDMIAKTALKESMVKLFSKVTEYTQTNWDSLLKSKELIEDLRDADLIVYEGMAFAAILVSELYKIPRVSVFPVIPRPGGFLMFPSPVSYVPMSFTGFTSKMSFLQRVMNLGAYFALNAVFHFTTVRPLATLKAKYNITPETDIQEALNNDELVIVSSDFALDYPQPLLPGQILVGPITVKKPKPLPAELESYVSSGTDGFIIVSFGSYMETLTSKDEIDVMAAAFGKLKQKVLWKLKGYTPSSLSANIRIVKWLPQNDLLAHKEIRAFVSHAGHNSLFESGYHGVPMVAIPLFADQFVNAKKAVDFGLALSLNLETLSSKLLKETIEQVVYEPSFKKSASRISKLMQDKPRSPLETTGDWIEYVLRHGGAQHLRAQVFNIPWYQYYLLDVLAFLISAITVVVMVIWMTCRCFCRLCCKGTAKKSKPE
ncbi:UDP-glucuronosyltransferase 2B15-like isoform X2 [Acropora muricata]|uniref:UDP-glucuronosyltransferase 2B15-like isoform X2 n=1 Tax=Acropora muricata TaxID=159855 RepID=UPI0034E57780